MGVWRRERASTSNLWTKPRTTSGCAGPLPGLSREPLKLGVHLIHRCRVLLQSTERLDDHRLDENCDGMPPEQYMLGVHVAGCSSAPGLGYGLAIPPQVRHLPRLPPMTRSE